MRRQAAGTAEVLRGESCHARLDPFDLPARVTYFGQSRAGNASRIAIVGRESVMIRRETASGTPQYTTNATDTYRGVLLSVRDEQDASWVGLRLHHEDSALCVPLFEAYDTDDVIADWQAWGRALGRPLLIENTDGEISEAQEQIGGLLIKPPKARRANRFFADRRPRFLCRRRVGGVLPGIIYSETEIIARGIAD